MLSRKNLNIGKFSKLIFASLLGCLSVAGCNDAKPGKTPAEAFNAIVKSLRQTDYKSVWKFLSRTNRQELTARISNEQYILETKTLPLMTEDDKKKFAIEYGISLSKYINLSPVEVFVMQMHRDATLYVALLELLDGFKLGETRESDDTKHLSIELKNGELVEIPFELDYGVYRLKSFSAMMQALRVNERLMTSGKTPQATFNAGMLIIKNGQYQYLWGLTTDGFKQRMLNKMNPLREVAKKITNADKNAVEQALGMSIDAYLALSDDALFAWYFQKDVLQGDINRQKDILQLKIISVLEVAENKDCVILKVGVPPSPGIEFKMLRVGGLWYFDSFK